MSALSEKILRARESDVPVGEFTFVIRRPTEVDMAGLRGCGASDLLRFIVGWKKVREMDLIPGGDPHPAPFDPEACAVWLSDRPDLMVPVVEQVVQAYQDHQAARDGAKKN
jgi:hypothetical protein